MQNTRFITQLTWDNGYICIISVTKIMSSSRFGRIFAPALNQEVTCDDRKKASGRGEEGGPKETEPTFLTEADLDLGWNS